MNAISKDMLKSLANREAKYLPKDHSALNKKKTSV